MKENLIYKNFKEGKKTIGTFSTLGSITAVELLCYAGVDCPIIDLEHSPMSYSDALPLMAAIENCGKSPIIRIPDITRVNVLKAFDTGADAIIVPGVNTIEEVKQLVEYSKYRPTGLRGYGAGRHGGYFTQEPISMGYSAFTEKCNRETLLFPQCETMGVLENVEEIAAIEGVDGIMLGPYDLSIAMGMPQDFGNPEFQKAIKRVLKACKDNGKISSILTGSAEDTKAKLEMGFDIALLSIDTIMLHNVYKNMIDESLGK